MKPYHRWIAFWVAFSAAVIAGFFCLYALIQLGAFTGYRDVRVTSAAMA